VDINERKLKILKAIIDDFIDTAQPVGSRTIAKKYPLGVSSATIRNEMADLEDLGFLVQPHISAGRIPSDAGYRLYVDELMLQSALGRDQMQMIRNLLLSNMIELEDVVNQAVTILSKVTGMTAVISLPQFNRSRLTNIKMVRINDSKVLMILVADSGVFKTMTLGIRGGDQYILDRITDVLTEKLQGMSISEINMRTIGSIKQKLKEYATVVDYLVPILRNTLREIDEVEVYVEGAHNVLNLPEFQDSVRAQQFFDLMEDAQKLVGLLSSSQTAEGISVRIGGELGMEELVDCSMITTSYKVNGQEAGKIAVFGPKRMDYGRAVSALDYIRDTLSEIFSGINL